MRQDCNKKDIIMQNTNIVMLVNMVALMMITRTVLIFEWMVDKMVDKMFGTPQWEIVKNLSSRLYSETVNQKEVLRTFPAESITLKTLWAGGLDKTVSTPWLRSLNFCCRNGKPDLDLVMMRMAILGLVTLWPPSLCKKFHKLTHA